jgi:MoaA/NifB/PqqE/SkfB family radical SAM enzyme
MSDFDPHYEHTPRCLAKWHRTNLRLYNGLTYSCHHCKSHPIDKEAIAADPAALTNTDYIRERRQEMLDGKRPDECGYCWEKEDVGEISDRKLKSDQFVDQLGVDPDETFDSLTAFPKILDVAFTNTCNFACSYCGPQNSSKWADDIRRYGEYDTVYRKTTLASLEKTTVPNREHNPYVEAFWQWWDQGLAENLDRLTITGGEPLLSKDTFRVLDRVMQDDHDMIININTNLCVPDANWERFVQVLGRLDRLISVSVSLESVGARAEYGRHGLDYDRFIKNLEFICDNPYVSVNMVTTNNALSYTSMPDFLRKVIEFKQRGPAWKFKMFSNEVRRPTYLDLRVLPREIREAVANEMKSIHLDTELWSEREIVQINRTIDFSLSEMKYQPLNQKDFATFTHAYDVRRSLDFDSTYPELAEWRSQIVLS